MASRKIVFIVNPSAATGMFRSKWLRIQELAKQRFTAFEPSWTAGPGHAIFLTRHALQQGAEVVVCVGGDGTLNEVVNGFMGPDGPIRPRAILGFIPLGTGCDLIKTISLPTAPEKAMDIIEDAHTRLMDLGRIIYSDYHGKPSLRYFHNVTSFGLGGEVDDRVNRTTKIFGGFVSFLWATLISILIYHKKRIHLTVDGGFIQPVMCWNVIVANGQYHGGGMWVAPQARVDDGIFHLTVLGDFTLAEVFWNLPKLYNGTLFQLAKVKTLVCKKIEASSAQRVLLDVDGEQVGRLPAAIDIVPGILPFIRP
ncbi:MAG: diacylglycerol/lipid kinase family protein [Thermodesulfobacteriota bacterium]